MTTGSSLERKLAESQADEECVNSGRWQRPVAGEHEVGMVGLDRRLAHVFDEPGTYYT
jgi:hypothetical protein